MLEVVQEAVPERGLVERRRVPEPERAHVQAPGRGRVRQPAAQGSQPLSGTHEPSQTATDPRGEGPEQEGEGLGQQQGRRGHGDQQPVLNHVRREEHVPQGVERGEHRPRQHRDGHEPRHESCGACGGGSPESQPPPAGHQQHRQQEQRAEHLGPDLPGQIPSRPPERCGRLARPPHAACLPPERQQGDPDEEEHGADQEERERQDFEEAHPGLRRAPGDRPGR